MPHRNRNRSRKKLVSCGVRALSQKVGAGAVEVPPVRGMKVRTVSTLTLLFALACLTAFMAARPPLLARYQGRMMRDASFAAPAAAGIARAES